MKARVSFGERSDLPSGCRVQHDFAALMWRVAKHFVGNASFLQCEHRADIRNQFSTVEQLCDLVQPRGSHIHIKVSGPNAITPLACLGNG
jgi:hypothetical protein